MTDDQPDRQEAFLFDVQARLQGVEDLLMSMDWKGIVVRTAHGLFEWRLGAIEEPRPARQKETSTRHKGARRRS